MIDQDQESIYLVATPENQTGLYYILFYYT